MNAKEKYLQGFKKTLQDIQHTCSFISKNRLCWLFSPDGSVIPSRFFYGMEYSGQQEYIFPDKAYSFAPNFSNKLFAQSVQCVGHCGQQKESIDLMG